MQIIQKGIILIITAAIAVFSPVGLSAGHHVLSHEIIIDGSSNIMSWSADVHQLSVSSDVVVENGQLHEIREMRVEIQVESIEGSEGSTMTRKIHEAFNKERNPHIVFELKEVLGLAAAANSYSIHALGDLSMAGVTRTIELDVTGEVHNNGNVTFYGTKTMLMTDWEMSPPRAMFGALRTRDEVEVSFRIVLKVD